MKRRNNDFDFEEKELIRKEGLNKSQQEILAQIKKKRSEQHQVKVQEVMSRAFTSEDEEGTTLIEEIASKLAAKYKNIDVEKLTTKELIELKTLLGEDKINVNVESEGLEKILGRISDDKRF